MFSGLSFALCYFIPTIIAWYRKKTGSPILGSLGQIFSINLLTGFTILGWFLALANAFNRNPVAWVATRLAGPLVKYGRTGAPPPPASGSGGGGSSSGMSCSACGGSGSVMCSSCGGRGSWYNPPTTATGTAQLQTCPACASSGRIRCMTCGGSGRVPGPIG